MRRVLLALGGAGVVALAGWMLWPTSGSAEPQPVAGQNLPLTQVVLFSSGVGYFQREGTVTGNARIDMTFPVQDINDLIKSMVLRDLDNGHIAAVSYDNNAPIDRTLKSFAINLTGNPTFANILNQARGAKAEVVLAQPGNLTGTIVGVEGEALNLWCADGMRALKLGDLQRIRFLNPTIDSEFKKALETLATSHDTQKKAVSIQCLGEGSRRVKVGYVVENPIWKTSYRLVLEKAEVDAKPYLQGWAVVENSTDEDWKDVRMALVSGRPISFQMDLSSPLFVDRPTERLELFQSLRAVAYSGALVRDGEEMKPDKESLVYGTLLESERFGAPLLGKSTLETKLGTLVTLNFKDVPLYTVLDDIRAYHGINVWVDKAALEARGISLEQKVTLKLEGVSLRTALPLLLKNVHLTYVVRDEVLQITTPEAARGAVDRATVRSAASVERSGSVFQYLIEKPVQLQRQKSALLPIIAKDIEGKRVSIYNERTHARFPLLGLQMKNTSGAHLMQGPITVFEGSVYGGDARISDLQPNEERLISYAVDLGTEVDPKQSSDNGRITSVKAVKGVITTTTRIRETKNYTIANRNDTERVLLVEHPVRNDFKLVEGARPAEMAADCYRFQVKVPAGKTVTETVTEECVLGSTVEILTANDEQIRVVLNQAATAPKVKQALEDAIRLRGDLAKTTRAIAEQERQLSVIVEDQKRLRANLREMPMTAAAYKRYLDKFDTQETQIEQYQATIKTLQASEHAKRKGFEDFVVGFNVE